MSAVTQMVILSVFASLSLILALIASTSISEFKQSQEKALLQLSRAKIEDAMFHLAYCGEDCSIVVELNQNITLSLSNQTCVVEDGLGNAMGCYFPFTTQDTTLQGSSFRLSLVQTKLGVVSLG